MVELEVGLTLEVVAVAVGTLKSVRKRCLLRSSFPVCAWPEIRNFLTRSSRAEASLDRVVAGPVSAEVSKGLARDLADAADG